jgi:hypothetical protein
MEVGEIGEPSFIVAVLVDFSSRLFEIGATIGFSCDETGM